MTPARFRFVDAKNSYHGELSSSSEYTGEWHDFNEVPFKAVLVSANADVSDCTLYMEYGSDGVTSDSSLSFKVVANIREVHKLENSSRYYRTRIVNTNGATANIKLSTNFGDFDALTAPMNLTIGLDNDALIVRPTDSQDEIRLGRRAGVRGFTKFGYREGLTAANGEETVWATTGNFTPMTTASTFTVTYTGGGGVNDGAGSTGALTLLFEYIDEDGLPTQSVHTLGSDGSDVTTFSGLGINRCVVSSTGSAQFNSATITVTETTGGTKQAVIPAQQSVTQQAIFFVGSNHDAVAKFLRINVNKLSGGGSPRVTIKGYVFNRNITTRFEIFRETIDTGVDNFIDIVEPIGFNLSPTDVLYWVADTDTNAAVVNLRFSLNEYQRT